MAKAKKSKKAARKGRKPNPPVTAAQAANMTPAQRKKFGSVSTAAGKSMARHTKKAAKAAARAAKKAAPKKATAPKRMAPVAKAKAATIKRATKKSANKKPERTIVMSPVASSQATRAATYGPTRATLAEHEASVQRGPTRAQFEAEKKKVKREKAKARRAEAKAAKLAKKLNRSKTSKPKETTVAAKKTNKKPGKKPGKAGKAVKKPGKAKRTTKKPATATVTTPKPKARKAKRVYKVKPVHKKVVRFKSGPRKGQVRPRPKTKNGKKIKRRAYSETFLGLRSGKKIRLSPATVRKHNPMFTTGNVVTMGATTVLGRLLAEGVDRFLATMPMSEGGTPSYGATAVQMYAAGAKWKRLVASGAPTGAFAILGGLLAYYNHTGFASAAFGLSLGYGLKFIPQVAQRLLGMTKLVDTNAVDWKNRLLPEYAEPVASAGVAGAARQMGVGGCGCGSCGCGDDAGALAFSPATFGGSPKGRRGTDSSLPRPDVQVDGGGSSGGSRGSDGGSSGGSRQYVRPDPQTGSFNGGGSSFVRQPSTADAGSKLRQIVAQRTGTTVLERRKVDQPK